MEDKRLRLLSSCSRKRDSIDDHSVHEKFLLHCICLSSRTVLRWPSKTTRDCEWIASPLVLFVSLLLLFTWDGLTPSSFHSLMSFLKRKREQLREVRSHLLSCVLPKHAVRLRTRRALWDSSSMSWEEYLRSIEAIPHVRLPVGLF